MPPPPEVVEVEFTVEHGLNARWDERRITALVRAIVARERPSPSGRRYVVSLHLVGDDAIRVLNAEHRGRNAPTDVLSFPLEGEGDAGEFALPPHAPVHLGDVVVSYPRTQEQAAQFGHSRERELAYLVAHGVLHILGYDHERPAEQEIMRSKEEEALQPLGFTRF